VHGRGQKGPDMRTFRQLAAATMTAGILAVTGASAASAATAHPSAPAGQAAAVALRGGHTTVTTAPGIAAALLSNGIIPIATLPGTEGASIGQAGVVVRFGFPVTGGQVSLNPLGGFIRHDGGILFLGVTTGKQIAVSDFTISLTHLSLSGIVNGNPQARVPLFRLNLAHATVTARGHCVTARGIILQLTKAAAGALNATFSTTLFKTGMVIGTAATTLHI
jgi:hypothetical protein